MLPRQQTYAIKNQLDHPETQKVFLLAPRWVFCDIRIVGFDARKCPINAIKIKEPAKDKQERLVGALDATSWFFMA